MTVISVHCETLYLINYIKHSFAWLCMKCCSGDVNTVGQFNSLYLHTSLRNLTCKPTHTEPEIYSKTHPLTAATLLYSVTSQLDSLLPQWERVIIAILPVFPRSWFNANPAEWSRRSAAAARARASLRVTPGARPQTFTAHARRMRGSCLSFWGDTRNGALD